MALAKGDARAVLTVLEAAKLLGLSKNSAYKAVHAGQIPAVKIGGKYVVPLAAFNRLLHRSGGSAAEHDSS